MSIFNIDLILTEIVVKLDGKKIIAVIDNFCSCEKKPEIKIRLVRDSNLMTSAIPVQRSTN